MRPVDAAADRFFRAYHAHCTMPDEDTLFNLLNALHSFNDKLRKATRHDLFGSINFQALKALRNLLHHESELMNRVKVVRVDSSTGIGPYGAVSYPSADRARRPRPGLGKYE